MEIDRGAVPNTELCAAGEAGDHGNVIGFSNEDGMAGAVERLGLHSSDLISRQNLQIDRVGNIRKR